MTGSHLLRGSYLLDAFADNIPNLTDYVCVYTLTNRRLNNCQPLTPLKFRRRASARSTPSLRCSLRRAIPYTSEDWTISIYAYGTLTAAKCGPGCQHAILRSLGLLFMFPFWSPILFRSILPWSIPRFNFLNKYFCLRTIFWRSILKTMHVFEKPVLGTFLHIKSELIGTLVSFTTFGDCKSCGLRQCLLSYNVATVQEMISLILPKNWQSPGHL